jgi:hypothetical protein
VKVPRTDTGIGPAERVLGQTVLTVRTWRLTPQAPRRVRLDVATPSRFHRAGENDTKQDQPIQVQPPSPIETLPVELKVGVTKSEGRPGFTVAFIGAEVGGSAGHGWETAPTVTLVLGSSVECEGTPVGVPSSTGAKKH